MAAQLIERELIQESGFDGAGNGCKNLFELFQPEGLDGGRAEHHFDVGRAGQGPENIFDRSLQVDRHGNHKRILRNGSGPQDLFRRAC